ncbi:MAG: DNA replication/repair protein RecF [Patescibacteria group bacterium]
MIIKIRLTSFRSIKNQLLEFTPTVTVILGPNASGKTNILEAVSLLSSGKSFRARIEEEMINYQKDLARVKGRIKKDGETVDLEAVLTRGTIDVGFRRPERVARKKLLINGLPKRLVDFAGNLKVTLFGPWDIELVTESPPLRRRFLDTVLSQVDREYRRASLSYEKGLRQRNKLLLRIREEGISPSQLLFWDKLLTKNGNYLSVRREEFIDFINETSSLNREKFNLEYDKSAISEGRLGEYQKEEIAAATTLVGPHRDDFIFRHEERELARFGSRGEQRMGVLWLKLAELAFIEEETGERPTLLLDDIFSELDHPHREIVMKVADKQQTIITTTDPHFIEGVRDVAKIRLEG